MATKKNLEFIRGDTIEFGLTFTGEENEDLTRDPVDITGSTVFFTMKVDKDDPDTSALIQKEVTMHSDPENGETSIVIEGTDWDGVDPGEYYYDIQIVFEDENVKTVLIGKVCVIQDITLDV